MPRPARPLVYVLAPSYIRFRGWCRERHRRTSEAVYVHHPSKIEGIPIGSTVATVEGWTEGRHARTLWTSLCAQEALAYEIMNRPLSHVPWPWPGDPDFADREAARRREVVQERIRDAASALMPAQEAARTTSNVMRELMETFSRAGVIRPEVIRTPLPTLVPGQVHAYLVNGPNAGQTLAVDPDARFWNTLSPGSRVTYSFNTGLGESQRSSLYEITTYCLACDTVCGLMSTIGHTHPHGGLCAHRVYVGYVGIVPTPTRDMVQRALDALLTGWRGALNYPSTAVRAPRATPRHELHQYTAEYRTVEYLPVGYTASALGTVNTSPAEDEPDTPDENGYYRPLSSRELNWTDWDESEDGTTVCAHVCGGDHQCDARATTTMEFKLPTGGLRRMPVCPTCLDAEQSGSE